MKAKLQTLKPQVPMQGDRLPVMRPGYGFDATPRDRGRPWRRKRAAWLAEHPLCCACEAKGRVAVAVIVDHVVPLWRGGADDASNYQSLCGPDHAAKSAREAVERAK